MKAVLLAVVAPLVSLTGCMMGPLTIPMVQRLEPESQRMVDESWKNMLTPPQRLDRTLLLDVICNMQLFQVGVDRVNFRSEKDVPDGKVVMEIDFRRDRVNRDRFTVTYYNKLGWKKR